MKVIQIATIQPHADKKSDKMVWPVIYILTDTGRMFSMSDDGKDEWDEVVLPLACKAEQNE